MLIRAVIDGDKLSYQTLRNYCRYALDILELPWHFAIVKYFSQRRYVMKVSNAGKIWLDYHQINSKKKYG
jgi:hypothetical protein